NPVYRRLLKMALEELRFIEQHIGQLDQEMATLLCQHQDAVQRLAEVPGLGVGSAQQIIAEVGATAASFPSEKHLSSWVGARPREFETSTHVENDPATPEPRLSRRTAGTEPSISSEEFSTQAHIKLSSLVSDLLGVSARRMLQALADGETDPATLAAMANKQL